MTPPSWPHPTECARDRDLYKLISCGKFVNDILFSTIYKTHYLTLGHYALAVILCLCLHFFFLSYQQLYCFDKAKLEVQYFCVWRSRFLAHPVQISKFIPFEVIACKWSDWKTFLERCFLTPTWELKSISIVDIDCCNILYQSPSWK